MPTTYMRSDWTVQDSYGRAVPGASVYWCTQPAVTTAVPPSPLATLYNDPAGDVIIANPQITNGYGQVASYLASGFYTVVTVWNGKIQQVYPDQFIGIVNSSVTIVANQVGVGNGINTIAGTNDFTYNDTTKALNITGFAGAAFIMDEGGDSEMLGGTISTGIVAHSATNVGVGNILYTISIDPGSTGTGGLQITDNIGSGPALVWDNSTGYFYLRKSSGLAGIGVATAAGSPAVILLPTATAAAGGLLVSDGNNPQQSSWTANLTYADEILTVTQTDTLDTPIVVNLTTTVPGTLDPAITFNDVALAHPISISRGDSIPFNLTGWYIGNAAFSGSSYIALSDDGSATYFNSPIVGLVCTPQNTGPSITVKGSGSNNHASIQFNGYTSGNAAIQIAAIAGNTVPIQLPITNSAANQTLISDGGNPQQLSWGGVTLLGATFTPASSGAAGVTGTIAWDASYIYICTATNTWKRVAISTW